MLIPYKKYSLNAEVLLKSETKNYIFLLHGFTGSLRDWTNLLPLLKINYNIVALDLLGHGKSDSPGNISEYFPNELSDQLNTVFNKFTSDKISLLGYSMGGRAALTYALANPKRIENLILESTSPGILSQDDRLVRIESDNSLADFIENHSIEEFVEYWNSIPLFTSQKNHGSFLTEQNQRRLENNKMGLANSLRGFGTGQMESNIFSLKYLNVNLLLITGELDTKFTTLSYEMSGLTSCKHVVIKNAGHNVHFEKPIEYAKVINEFLA